MSELQAHAQASDAPLPDSPASLRAAIDRLDESLSRLETALETRLQDDAASREQMRAALDRIIARLEDVLLP